jgi:hypothetical protein
MRLDLILGTIAAGPLQPWLAFPVHSSMFIDKIQNASWS